MSCHASDLEHVAKEEGWGEARLHSSICLAGQAMQEHDIDYSSR